MHDREFEKKVHQQMQELRLAPGRRYGRASRKTFAKRSAAVL